MTNYRPTRYAGAAHDAAAADVDDLIAKTYRSSSPTEPTAAGLPTLQQRLSSFRENHIRSSLELL